MSKRMSLVEATNRRKDDFVRTPATTESELWQDAPPEVASAPPSPPRPTVQIVRTDNRQLPEVPKKKTTFNIDAALHRRLKLTAVHQEREMVDIVEEALLNHLRNLERADSAMAD